jgi:hypothetical protein
VPQHLAYVRLLTSFRQAPSSFPAVYAAPDMSSGYATAYALLVRLSAFMPPDLALRGAVTVYVVLLAVSVRALVHATWRVDGEDGVVGPTTFLGPLVALNPVLCMGLLAYLFALPAVVGAFAAAVGYVRSASRLSLLAAALLAAAAGALHSVAAAALLFLAGAMFVARRDRRSGLAVLVCLSGALLGSRAAGSSTKLPPGLGAMLLHNIQTYGIVDGTLGTFRISFTHWFEKLDQVVASVVGPFPFGLKLLAGAVLVLVVVADWRARAGTRRDEVSVRAVPGARFAVVMLAVAAVLAPAALQIPDDLSLLDFRLITTATLVGVILVPPGLFQTRRMWVYAGGAAALLLLWARQLNGAAGEVMQTVRLVERLGPGDTVLALSMHDESAYLDERNEILHYAPVYHTARTGGVTSLFWGKFSPRLPIGYRPGQNPPAPGDWAPWEMTDDQLTHYTHVVVRWPAADDDARLVALAQRLTTLEREGTLEPVASDGPCALFKVASVTRTGATTAAPRRPSGAVAIHP